MPMKSIYRTILAAAGSFLAAQFGGWDAALETLVCFMAIDWITGGVLLPVVFKKSPKSENGTLESRAGWKGLCRKGMMLFFVLVAEKLDQLTQTNYLRDAVCIGFILNEADYQKFASDESAYQAFSTAIIHNGNISLHIWRHSSVG